MNFVDSPFASLPLGNYSSPAVTGSLRFEGGVIHWHPRRCGPTSLSRLLRLLPVVISFSGLHWFEKTSIAKYGLVGFRSTRFTKDETMILSSNARPFNPS